MRMLMRKLIQGNNSVIAAALSWRGSWEVGARLCEVEGVHSPAGILDGCLTVIVSHGSAGDRDG